MIQGYLPTRNTKSYSLNIDDVNLFFSYETLIAASYQDKRARVHNHWGPATGRHMKEMEVAHWPIMSSEELEEFAKQLLYTQAMNCVVSKLTNGQRPAVLS